MHGTTEVPIPRPCHPLRARAQPHHTPARAV